MTTPHIDRLAGEGVLFLNAYSASCWTVPAHASLFTGLYPSEHQLDLDHHFLDSAHRTLAGALRERGYSTACISCNSFVARGIPGLSQGFDLALDIDGGYREGMRLIDRGVRKVQKSWRTLFRRDRGAGAATQAAGAWMSHQERPFFLFMNYMDCHLPYRLRRPQRYAYIPFEERGRSAEVPLDPFAVMAGALSLSAQELELIRAQYDGCLTYLDAQVGRLAAHLQKLGRFEDTIFIVTSDHGESFGEHGLHDHQYGLYEHLLRVPLVARFPGARWAGEHIPGWIQHVDLPGLLLSLVDAAESPPDEQAIHQRSVRHGALLSGSLPSRDVLLAEYLHPNLRPFQRRFPRLDASRFDRPLRSIRVGDSKLILGRDGRRELYDLAADPGELYDLSSLQPGLADDLEQRLLAELGPWPEPAQGSTPGALAGEVRERLEALGYL